MSIGNRNTGRGTWCCDAAYCNDNENNIPLPEPLRSGAVSVVNINAYMLALYFVFQTGIVLGSSSGAVKVFTCLCPLLFFKGFDPDQVRETQCLSL